MGHSKGINANTVPSFLIVALQDEVFMAFKHGFFIIKWEVEKIYRAFCTWCNKMKIESVIKNRNTT